MSKKAELYRDMDDKPIHIGARVELHPGYDLWMQGATHGRVVAAKKDKLCVRMDHRQVKKLVCVPPADLKVVRS